LDTIPGMPLTTFKIGKQEFVIVPRRRYDQLTRAERDQKDSEIARKGREAYLSGKVKPITHEELKRRLGV
jgi:hypothetical protein